MGSIHIPISYPISFFLHIHKTLLASFLYSDSILYTLTNLILPGPFGQNYLSRFIVVLVILFRFFIRYSIIYYIFLLPFGSFHHSLYSNHPHLTKTFETTLLKALYWNPFIILLVILFSLFFRYKRLYQSLFYTLLSILFLF